MSPFLLLTRSRRPPAGTQPGSRSTVQGTTLDLLWIRDAVVCFASGPRGTPVYRAVLALEGPAHTPRDLAAADPGALAGYRALLASLDHPLQVLVRDEPADAAAEAARWEDRAARLPPPLDALAREHAAWARRELPALGLLVRRAYLVVPAEDPPADRSPTAALRQRLRRPVVAADQRERAREMLGERCARLMAALGAAGLGAWRLDDLALARLYRACWSPETRNGDRLDRDLVAVLGRQA